jgi:hypothetical protein
MLVGRTNRRGFLAALGSAAAWPLVARAQGSMVEKNLLVMLGLACLLTVAETKADEIRAKNETVQFDFEAKADVQGRTCNLMAMILDPSRPEVVNFRIIHALSPMALFFGFSLDVGDMRYQNGLPAGVDHAVLARGDVSAGSFSSEGSMYGGPAPDGGIVKSTMDGETAGKLWQGILSGNFSIHLLRATPGAKPRTYVVSETPTREALSKYLACSTEISDVALGNGASPDLYARIRQGGPGITEPTPGSSGHSVIPPLSRQTPLVGKR